MKYLIDTNICIYIINKRPAAVIKKFKQFELGEIGISTITVSELQYGVAKSTYRKKNEVRLEEFLAPLEILTYDQTAARVYGDIRFQLEKRGRPIGPLDLLIAAHAISQNLVLITNNDKEFKRIKKLKIENWTK
jgi:tRNA(fMet)-specific endonuclease VapC